MEFDTIAAISTPVGCGGIGIIKISGKDAFSIAAQIFRRSGGLSSDIQSPENHLFSSLKSHQLYHGHIITPENGRIFDEVLLSMMRAPLTYTREDVVEINSHSGYIVLSSILDLVLKKGARLAEPGEFTKRAYLNGRIDLTQAEAVIDVINSRTEQSLQIAAAQIKGGLRNCVESIRNTLLDILTEMEAAIDFPEDIEEIIPMDRIVGVLEKNVTEDLKGLVEHYENAHFLREGLKMAVVGKPNVGKSSLMNRLLKEDRAIVTPFPGTTRDLIEETLNIRGIPVIVADTAGLHETDDPVEVIGMEKTQKYIESSDLILFMVDVSNSLTREDHDIYEKIKGKRLIVVLNKEDLLKDKFRFKIPEGWKRVPNIMISARYGSGLDSLKALIEKLSLGEYRLEVHNTIIPNLRHKTAIESSVNLIHSAVEEIRKGTPFELVTIDIQEAIDRLGEIIGVVAKEDIIDEIFSRFCIGK